MTAIAPIWFAIRCGYCGPPGGLSESELANLLGDQTGPLPRAIWSGFYMRPSRCSQTVEGY